MGLDRQLSELILGSQILCAKDAPRHVFLWHFAPVVVAGLVGIHLGRWPLTRPSIASPATDPWTGQ